MCQVILFFCFRANQGISQDIPIHSSASTRKFYFLLCLQTFICFWCNGALPSIQTYSCLPYGNIVYHLAVTLSAMANPTMAFVANFFPCKKLSHILILTVLGSVFSAFIFATALYSPDKLWGQDVGGAFTVRETAEVVLLINVFSS